MKDGLRKKWGNFSQPSDNAIKSRPFASIRPIIVRRAKSGEQAAAFYTLFTHVRRARLAVIAAFALVVGEGIIVKSRRNIIRNGGRRRRGERGDRAVGRFIDPWKSLLKHIGH